MERKLASVRRIADIQPIEGADNIEVVTVDGWKIVAQKAMGYRVGDLVVYFEIDSWIPHELAPFLTKDAQLPRVFNGVKGERLKTVKLRGQISQGLLMPMSACGFTWNPSEGAWEYPEGYETDEVVQARLDDGPEFKVVKTADGALFVERTVYHLLAEEGDDVTELLGIQKWEPPLPGELVGKARGTFPTHLAPKTDQERVQNLWNEIKRRDPGETYEVTVKIDGSSMSVFWVDRDIRVASRNMELLVSEENAGNSYIKKALELKPALVDMDDIVLQGELWGANIQGNHEGIRDIQFSVFDIVDGREKVLPEQRRFICDRLGIKHVPVLYTHFTITPEMTLEDILAMADGPSAVNSKSREGIVFKSNSDPNFSFKVISNSFLLKTGK